ncbi:hypothetical protein V5E97_25600 [Singulisphaera sp. Ch08]|uniref:Transposase n=1 Tax=Singulisphaera sp. Ch08 TaxID=3120278 RepID=A0AAU7C916_9BACT
MTSAEFYKLVLALWGEHWRQKLPKLLAKYSHSDTRQTFWNWQHGTIRKYRSRWQ